MNYHQIWNTFSYALNGFVFVVLGFMIPTVIIGYFPTEPDNFSFLIVITILIAIAIYACWISLGLFLVQRFFIAEKYTILSRQENMIHMKHHLLECVTHLL